MAWETFSRAWWFGLSLTPCVFVALSTSALRVLLQPETLKACAAVWLIYRSASMCIGLAFAPLVIRHINESLSLGAKKETHLLVQETEFFTL